MNHSPSTPEAQISFAQAVAEHGVAQWLDDGGLSTVHVGLFDASGVLREKRLGRDAAARAFEHGWSFIDAIQWWAPDDTLWHEAGAGTSRVLLEPDSGRPYPLGESAAIFFGEFTPPLCELSPRHQVRRMVDRASQAGVEARVGWEFECFVLDPSSGTAGPIPAMGNNHCWSAVTMGAEAESLDRLAGVLHDGAVLLDHVCAELGPGCLEIATLPEAALRSADSAALAKLYTKAHFAREGRTATFMAQLGQGYPGLGGHPSISLHSALDGSPVLVEAPGVLSKAGLSAVAGVVALLPELLAMAAPFPNSYRRFGPGNWAPATATWGIGNYSCALRVVADNPTTARLELRIPGADVSPHHCLAMLLGAALWGIEKDLEPPAPVTAPADGRAASAAVPLPRDLTEAVERLTASDAARDLFGATFVDHFAGSRRAEVAACHRFVSDQERDRYLAYV